MLRIFCNPLWQRVALSAVAMFVAAAGLDESRAELGEGQRGGPQRQQTQHQRDQRIALRQSGRRQWR